MNRKRIRNIFIGTVSTVLLSVAIYQFAYAQTFQTGFLSSGAAGIPAVSDAADRVAAVDQAGNADQAVQTDNAGNAVKAGNTVQTADKLTETSSQKKDFTLETLKMYNGKNGQPAYVAVDGIVYDVTALPSWRGGSHMGFNAGQDLSKAFAWAPHGKSVLKKSPIVGKLVTSIQTVQQPDNQTVPAVEQVSQTNQTPRTNQTAQVGQTSQVDQTSQINQTSQANQTPQVQTADKSGLTLEELAKYNGLNGQPAYIAIDGIVYDVTSIRSWRNGSHMGYKAGQDLTKAFSWSPHGKSILKRAIVIGKLVPSSGTITKTAAQPKPVTQANTTNTVPTATVKKQGWTLEKLAQYNGQNGQPAYVAVNGIIYDVTSMGSWAGGSHRGIKAGQDVTQAFASSPHSASLLRQLPVIGTLDNASVAATVPLNTPADYNGGKYEDDGDHEGHDSDNDHEEGEYDDD